MKPTILLTGLLFAGLLSAQQTGTAKQTPVPPVPASKPEKIPPPAAAPNTTAPPTQASDRDWATYWRSQAIYFQAAYQEEHERYMEVKYPQQAQGKEQADGFFAQQQRMQQAQQTKAPTVPDPKHPVAK